MALFVNLVPWYWCNRAVTMDLTKKRVNTFYQRLDFEIKLPFWMTNVIQRIKKYKVGLESSTV